MSVVESKVTTTTAIGPHIRTHDQFNLVALTIISVLDVWYLACTTDLRLIGTDELGQDPVSYPIFLALLLFFTLYICVDIVWIYLIPASVHGNQSTAVLVHHLVTLVQLVIPWLNQNLSWHFAITLVVEINTLVLVCRRSVRQHSAAYQVLDLLFYATWIIFRLLLFPLLVLFCYSEYMRLAARSGYLNSIAVSLVTMTILTVMSYKWTYDLIIKQFRKKK